MKRIHTVLLLLTLSLSALATGIYNVRDFLGHESVTTTQVYLTSNPNVTRKAIESAAAQTVPESVNHFSPEERDASAIKNTSLLNI